MINIRALVVPFIRTPAILVESVVKLYTMLGRLARKSERGQNPVRPRPVTEQPTEFPAIHPSLMQARVDRYPMDCPRLPAVHSDTPVQLLATVAEREGVMKVIDLLILEHRHQVESARKG